MSKKTPTELLEMGFESNLVMEIFRKIKLAEFKRRQLHPV
jgi:hypothetical protein